LARLKKWEQVVVTTYRNECEEMQSRRHPLGWSLSKGRVWDLLGENRSCDEKTEKEES